MSDSDRSLRIVVFTIDDSVFVPLAIESFLERYKLQICHIFVSKTWRPSRALERIKQFFKFAILSPRFLYESSLLALRLITNRKQKPSELARRHGLSISSLKRFNEQTVSTLKDLRPDLFIFCPFDLIAGPKTLAIPRLGTINVHFAQLPKYRGGVSTFFWSLLNGDEIGHVTMHSVSEVVDSGQIIATKSFQIKSRSLFNYMEDGFRAGGDMLVEVFENLDLELDMRSVDYESSTYFKFPTRSDLRTFWARGNYLCD